MLRQKKSKGFTLIEVMAAVSVFAISATGLYAVNQQSVFLSDRLESKTFAQWIALNKFSELEMTRSLPATGSETSTEEMAELEWRVKSTITETPLRTVRKVSIEVSLVDGPPLATISSYIGKRTPEGLNAY